MYELLACDNAPRDDPSAGPLAMGFMVAGQSGSCVHVGGGGEEVTLAEL
jgi:hypothetical protein